MMRVGKLTEWKMSMAALLGLILALFLAFTLVFAGLPEEFARPFDPVAQAKQVTAPLTIEDEPIERLALPTGDSGSAYVASAVSLFEQNSSTEWLRIADAPPAGEIVFDGADPDVILVGNEGNCFAGVGELVYQASFDGGQTWNEAPGDSLFVRPLAVWSATGLIVGAGCEGLLVSRDLGTTWEGVSDDLLGLTVTGFAVVGDRDQTVLVGLTGEGGTTRLFQFDFSVAVTTLVPEPLLEYYGIGGLAGVEDRFFVASITGISSSDNAGETWTVDRAGLEDVTLERDPLVDGLPLDLDPAVYGLYSIYLDGEHPALVGSATAIYQHWSSDVRPADMAGWELLTPIGAMVTKFANTPSGMGVLSETEGAVWLVMPETLNS